MNEEPWKAAIENFDWSQPYGRDWNPCFRVMEDGQCCGRAKRWVGHEPGKDHSHISLLEFIQAKLSAREKRMREVAEEIDHYIGTAPTEKGMWSLFNELPEWRTKLLEGLES